jgi:cell growth-regulating nucleolar protein
MTEDQKYQGALYKEKGKKGKNNKPVDKPQPQLAVDTKAMHHQQAYVEDVGEDRAYESGWDAYEGHTDDEKSPAELLPEAPTPPSAAGMDDDHVNVFDFLVATGQTPNASKLNLPQAKEVLEENTNTSLVRYEYNAEEYLEAATLMEDDDEPLVEYGAGPVPTALVTPLPKAERKKVKVKDSDTKMKKRKRDLHLEIPGDHPMTDAPPVLHSGLTGGLSKLMPVLPPSPDYSAGDNGEPSPASPLKKTKSKHTKNGQITNSLFGMLSGTSKMKTKTKTKKSSSSKSSKKTSSRHKEDKQPKLIEYRPRSKDGKTSSGEGQMIVYKPRADVFLSFVNKGPESERGCSMNKALRRFHRERQASGSDLPKVKEEKELFKSLRLRRNERGEIVLFSEDFDLNDVL